MQLSNVVTHYSRTRDVTAAQGQWPIQQAKTDRLETLQNVRNDTRNAASAGIDSRLSRSAISAHATMSTIASGVAFGLYWIATLPLAHATIDEGEGGGLIVPSSGSEIAVRSYGAAQLMRDHPTIGTITVITTIALVCGSVFGLLRPSTSIEGPSAQAQVGIGATAMSACDNLIAEIQDARSASTHAQSIHTQLVPKLEQIVRWTDELVLEVDNEINRGTQAASLESIRECIDSELKEGALEPLQVQLRSTIRQLQLGGLSIERGNLETIGGKLYASARLAAGIHEKLEQAVDLITTEIDRQNAISLPRIG